jgi:putative transposase
MSQNLLHVLTEIKNRGVGDVLMVVCDSLKGLPQAIEQAWPLAVVQTCVVHLLRASFRYAGRQHWDAIAKALRPVYTAPPKPQLWNASWSSPTCGAASTRRS